MPSPRVRGSSRAPLCLFRGHGERACDYLRMACGSINASIPTHSRDFWIKLARYAASCLRRLSSQRALAKGTEERVLAFVSQQKRHFVDVESRVRKQLPPTRTAHRVQKNLETGAFAAKAALQGALAYAESADHGQDIWRVATQLPRQQPLDRVA